MKAVITIFLIFILVTVNRAQDNSFLKTILGDRECRTCHFLSLEVESAAYNGRVVVENDDLFDFVKSTKKLTWSEYKDFAYGLLVNNRKLYLKSYNVRVNGRTALYIPKISENTFRIVPQNSEFEVVASKGCIEFIKELFIEHVDAAKMNGKLEGTDCREFILSQNSSLSIVRKLSALDESFVIDKLFHWEIPVVNDHYNGLTIRRYDLPKLASNVKQGL